MFMKQLLRAVRVLIVQHTVNLYIYIYIVQYCTMYIYTSLPSSLRQMAQVKGLEQDCMEKGTSVSPRENLQSKVTQFLSCPPFQATFPNRPQMVTMCIIVQLVPAITARKNRLKNCNSNEYLLMGWSESHTRTSLTFQ